MGGFSAQVQSPQTSQPAGKGSPISKAVDIASQPAQQPPIQPQGKGGVSTNSATSGQPRMGMPNNYANTVGGWDNASIQPQRSSGKGKGY